MPGRVVLCACEPVARYGGSVACVRTVLDCASEREGRGKRGTFFSAANTGIHAQRRLQHVGLGRHGDAQPPQRRHGRPLDVGVLVRPRGPL